MGYEKQYYNLTSEAGFGGARNLISLNKRSKRKANEVEKKKIYQWLSNQDAYTLHRSIKRKFPRLHYNVSNIDDVWEIDLAQFTSIKNENDGFSYILVVIDVLSKYAWVEILKDKTTASVIEAFKKIVARAKPRLCVLLQSDKGGEFTSLSFQNLLKKLDVKFRVARNPDIKSCIAERLIRTIKEKMYRYFTYKNTYRHIDVIQKIIHGYNYTRHSGTKMRPVDVNVFNANKARQNLDKRALSQMINKHSRNKRALNLHPKYSIDSYVRISRSKGTFERG